MTNDKLEVHIRELEKMVEETQALIREGYNASLTMPEPIKMKFVLELMDRQNELNTRKIVINNLKGLIEVGF